MLAFISLIKIGGINMDKKIGSYSFIGGVIIAVILGLFSAYITPEVSAILISVLVALGLIVGFINVAGKETKEFLIVAVVLVIATSMGQASATLGEIQFVGEYLVGVFANIMAFIVPAIVIVGLKDIVKLTKEP